MFRWPRPAMIQARLSLRQTPASSRPTAPATRSPIFSMAGPYSDLDQQSTNTNGYGASLQVTNRDELFGHPNQLVAGSSFDGAQTLFSGSTQIGGLSLADRVFAGPGSPSTRPTARSRRCASASPMLITALFFTDTFDFTPQLAGKSGGPLQSCANRSERPAGQRSHRQPHLQPLQPGRRIDLQDHFPV